MAIQLILILVAFLIAGCAPSGPATTHTNSSQFATVAERADFLHRYVTFRRTYETLDFDIKYQNNGGGLVPAPSESDIRLVAMVPEAELQAWVLQGIQKSPTSQTDWLKSVPTSLDLSGVREWYCDDRREVGLDRARRLVVYRVWAN